MKTQKTCLQCQAPLSGRHDKKFCSEGCRAIANYEKRHTARLPTQRVNHILWRNYEILRTLWNNRPTSVTRDELLSHGYNFTCYTSHYTTATGIYYACYDFGFQPRIINGTKSALIVKMLKMTQPDPWDVPPP